MAEPKHPTSKAEVLDFIARGRADLEKLLEGLSDEQFTQPGRDGGWSVKDHLAHLAVWEVGIAALLRKDDRWQAMGVSRDVADSNDEDALNAIIQANNDALSLDDVRARFAQAHHDLLSALEPLTFEDLMQPYSHFDPESGRNNPVAFYLAGNTWSHWNEHIPWIRELVEAME